MHGRLTHEHVDILRAAAGTSSQRPACRPTNAHCLTWQHRQPAAGTASAASAAKLCCAAHARGQHSWPGARSDSTHAGLAPAATARPSIRPWFCGLGPATTSASARACPGAAITARAAGAKPCDPALGQPSSQCATTTACAWRCSCRECKQHTPSTAATAHPQLQAPSLTQPSGCQ
jgi:hypothetical protein